MGAQNRGGVTTAEELGEEERGTPPSVVGIGVGPGCEEGAGHLRVPFESDPSERGLATIIRAVNFGPEGEEAGHGGGVPVVGREHEEGVSFVVGQVDRQPGLHHGSEGLRVPLAGEVQCHGLELGVPLFLFGGDKSAWGGGLGTHFPLGVGCNLPTSGGRGGRAFREEGPGSYQVRGLKAIPRAWATPAA